MATEKEIKDMTYDMMEQHFINKVNYACENPDDCEDGLDPKDYARMEMQCLADGEKALDEFYEEDVPEYLDKLSGTDLIVYEDEIRDDIKAWLKDRGYLE